MSTSDLYILNGKSTRHLAEFRNGWGSAPMAWDYLAEKYIPEKPAYSLAESHLEKVWKLAEDDRLEPFERCVLMMTFDRSYVPVANLKDAAEACEMFGKACENGKHVNHWVAIGAALREAAGMRFSRHTRGVALSCTSVNDCWAWPSEKWLTEAWPIFEAAQPLDLSEG